MAGQNNVPPAWYPDQNVPGQLRWWDGQDWTADVRPAVVVAPDPMPVAATSVLDGRHGLHAVAKPAEGFGHATSEQLRGWPPPQPELRNEVEVPVREIPRSWAANESVDTIKGWIAKSAEPVVEPVAVAVAVQPAEELSGEPVDEPAEDTTATRPYADLSDWQPAAPQLIQDADDKHVATPPVEQPAPGPVPPTPAPPQPVQPQGAVALTRRQLRELMGPLTTGVEAE